MADGTYRMQTEEVHTGGQNIQKQAEEFGYARKRVDNLVERLTTAYPSSDGIEIANKIRSYDPTLNKMQEKLQRNGEFGVEASRMTVATNEEIRSNVAKNI